MSWISEANFYCAWITGEAVRYFGHHKHLLFEINLSIFDSNGDLVDAESIRPSISCKDHKECLEKIRSTIEYENKLTNSELNQLNIKKCSNKINSFQPSLGIPLYRLTKYPEVQFRDGSLCFRELLQKSDETEDFCLFTRITDTDQVINNSGAQRAIERCFRLDRKVLNLLSYVSPKKENFRAHGSEITNTFVLICMEFETQCKHMLHMAGVHKPDNKYNIDDYKTLLKRLHVDDWGVGVAFEGNLIKIAPFEDLKHSQVMWFSEYSSLKHNLIDQGKEGNLLNVLKSMCALHIISRAQTWENLETMRLDEGLRSSVVRTHRRHVFSPELCYFYTAKKDLKVSAARL